MTGLYEWNPMPHVVALRCPECGGAAEFEFAEVVRIARKKDVDYFRNSKLFEYRFLRDRMGNGWHAAFYFPRIHGRSTEALQDLPDGYSPENWNHSKYLYRSHGLDVGAINCAKCHLRRKHDLKWPQEAFYQVEYHGSTLWSFNRESSIDLRDFIASLERNVDTFKWQQLLLHVPRIFLSAKARDTIVKRLDRLISNPE